MSPDRRASLCTVPPPRRPPSRSRPFAASARARQLAGVAGMLAWLGTGLAAATWAAESPGVKVTPLPAPAAGAPGFTLLAPEQTGLAFTNLLLPEPEVRNQNLLNGSGLALGDYDGDGWCDVFLCNLNGSSALFRNLGGWRFTNVTAAVGLANTNELARGAVFADVDGDGDLDLLVSYSGAGVRLFRNDGRGRFQDAQAESLRAETGSTTLTLGDVDGDGDLDLYVANYGENTLRSGMKLTTRMVGGREQVVGRFRHRVRLIDGQLVEYGEPDAFYLNDGAGGFTRVPWTGGAFRDETGRPLQAEFWDMGLTAVIRDFNQDGRPDIYVCNDFHTPDRFWLGDGRGGFRLLPRPALRSTPQFSMALDAADFNGDGWLDFFVSDMLGRQHEWRMKQLRSPVPAPRLTLEPEADRPQVQRNMLFLNRGDGTWTELANRAGLAASDWSWTVACLDVDLDGREDLLIGTGHDFDALDQDAIERKDQLSPAEKQNARRVLELFPPLRVPNCVFRNRGDLTFEEVGRAWGFDSLQVSHSLALGDLDNDGDLDVVVNCLRAPALVYRNNTGAPRVAVRLRGRPPNTRAIGTWIRLRGGAVPEQIREVTCGGLYLAGSDTLRVFAAGNARAGMTLEVFWRSGRYTRLEDVRANGLYELDEAAADAAWPAPPTPPSPTRAPLFRDESATLGHTHEDAPFDDFARQRLLPRRLSTLGPGVAWLDADGDGREDLFVGGGRGGRLAGFRNLGAGRFESRAPATPGAALPDDVTGLCGAPLGEGRVSLLYALASYESGQTNTPALWRADFPARADEGADAPARSPAGASPGAGEIAAVPLLMTASAGPVALADWDGDGDLDAFVGARVVPGRYPESGASWLLRQHGGQFQPDPEASAALREAGLVSGALFSDLDGDGWPELVLACEWGPVRVYRNERGRFREVTAELGLAGHTGWWNSVTAGDFDGDGRLDLVAGNWGENSPYQLAAPGPWLLYSGDFVGDEGVHLIEAWSDPATSRVLPWRGMSALEKDLIWLRARFPTHAAFARASVPELLAGFAPRRAEARQLASLVFLNRGARFEARPLPLEAQLAPAFGLAVADFDGDGREDLFVAQGFFGTRPEDGRLDAGRGLVLLGDGRGGFTAMSGAESGVVIYGEQRGAAVADYDGDGRPDLVVTQHGGATQLLRNVGARPGLRVRLAGPPGNPAGVGAVLRWTCGERAGPAREVRAGGGYWSQDGFTQVLAMPAPPGVLRVRWPGGVVREYALPSEARELTVHVSGKLEVSP